MFVLQMLLFGISSGASVLAAQYWGKGDTRAVERVMGLSLRITFMISALFALAGALVPGTIMHIFTADTELIDAGSRYLRAVSAAYVLGGMSTVYLSVMRSVERVRISAAVHCSAVVLNVFLNACFIFGLGPFPSLGIVGVALATSVTRMIEALVCFLDSRICRIIRLRLSDLLARERQLMRDFIRFSVPAAANDIIWGLAFSLYSVILGHLSSDIVAANSVVSVARDLVTVVGFGIAAAASIMLGKEIGENRLEEAKKDASSILRVTIFSGIIAGLILLAVSPFIPGLVKISETAAEYLRIMLYINVAYQMGQIVNTVLIASLFRCGGNSKFGMVLDIICMWGFAVPLGLISAFVLELSPIWVYALMCTDEFAKMPFAVHHYRKGNWIRNITREIE